MPLDSNNDEPLDLYMLEELGRERMKYIRQAAPDVEGDTYSEDEDEEEEEFPMCPSCGDELFPDEIEAGICEYCENLSDEEELEDEDEDDEDIP